MEEVWYVVMVSDDYVPGVGGTAQGPVAIAPTEEMATKEAERISAEGKWKAAWVEERDFLKE